MGRRAVRRTLTGHVGVSRNAVVSLAPHVELPAPGAVVAVEDVLDETLFHLRDRKPATHGRVRAGEWVVLPASHAGHQSNQVA
jgi:hypothetical protein